MVDSASAVLLKQPVQQIEATFHDAIAKDLQPSSSSDYGIPVIFEKAFEESAEVSKIPLLTDMSIEEVLQANGRLVRTICYVTHSDTEIYGGALRHEGRWHLGRYGLDTRCVIPTDDSDLLFEERTSLLCRSLNLSSASSIEQKLEQVQINNEPTTHHTAIDEFFVKLYNESEEGLLHACLDVIGVLEVIDTDVVLHALVTKNQRLASMVSSVEDSLEQESDTSDVRAEVLQTLEEALNGDQIAAELTLLCLISGVTTRTPMLLGPLSLNLSNVEPAMATRVAAIINQITAHSLCFDMGIGSLNTAKLFPSHDGESFSTGAMQLPTDSAVILNESALSEGSLNERGVKNLQCIANTIDTQNLVFHFPFNEFKIPMNLAIITLSHGKSLLPSTVSIPLRRSAVWNLNARTSILEKQQYLARCRMCEVEIPEDLSTEIQEDFVKSRKQGVPMDQEDLSMSLALAKELTRSKLRRQMTWQDYERARKLRKQIVERRL